MCNIAISRCPPSQKLALPRVSLPKFCESWNGLLVLSGWLKTCFPCMQQSDCWWAGSAVCKKSALRHRSAQIWNAHTSSRKQTTLGFWGTFDISHVIFNSIDLNLALAFQPSFLWLSHVVTNQSPADIWWIKSTKKQIASEKLFVFLCRCQNLVKSISEGLHMLTDFLSLSVDAQKH